MMVKELPKILKRDVVKKAFKTKLLNVKEYCEKRVLGH